MSSLKLHGFLVSQPTRAVAWLLKAKGVAFEVVPVVPRNGDTKKPAFLKMNPNGLVPVLQDGDFTLFEGNAILQYLAEKHGWSDEYPTDPKRRAKVNQYLHWHHANMRQSTTQVIRPAFAKVRGEATPEHLAQIGQRDAIVSRYLTIFEKFFVANYVAETNKPTIADYAAYCELDQLETLDLFDFGKFPKTTDWMARMKDIPHHDDVRQDLYGLKAMFQASAP